MTFNIVTLFLLTNLNKENDLVGSTVFFRVSSRRILGARSSVKANAF